MNRVQSAIGAQARLLFDDLCSEGIVHICKELPATNMLATSRGADLDPEMTNR
jgi:hypothetical protein